MSVQMFPNKAYKLQKRYICHMMHKPRHISIHKWIARVAKLNNYLTEFPMPVGIVVKEQEDEAILEVLENGISTSWKFQMDKEGFNASSSAIRKFTETCVYYKECMLKRPRKAAQFVKATLREEGST
eukprot:1399020-Ditylum_brightwellii.AAC.1